MVCELLNTDQSCYFKNVLRKSNPLEVTARCVEHPWNVEPKAVLLAEDNSRVDITYKTHHFTTLSTEKQWLS